MNKKAVRNCFQLLGQKLDKINRFPLRSYESYGKKFKLDNIIFELKNITHYLTGDNNLFHPSLFPSLYKKFFQEDYRYFRLLILGEEFSKEDLSNLVSENLEAFRKAELIKEDDEHISFKYRLLSIRELNFLTDMYSEREDMVWLSSDSLNTGRMIEQRLPEVPLPQRDNLSVMDIGCGSGFVGIYTASLLRNQISRLDGFDINSRAVTQASLNIFLNDFENINSNFYEASIYEHELNQKYDIIVSNPAYGSSPYEEKRLCHYGGETGIEQTMHVFKKIEQSLHEDGAFFVMSDSPLMDGTPILFEELKRVFGNQFDLTYETLYEYDTTNMKLDAPTIDGKKLHKRQRAFIYGQKLSDSGFVRTRNRTAPYLIRF